MLTTQYNVICLFEKMPRGRFYVSWIIQQVNHITNKTILWFLVCWLFVLIILVSQLQMVSIVQGIPFVRQRQRARSDTSQLFSSAYFFSANCLSNKTPVKLFLGCFSQTWDPWLFLASRKTRRMRIFWELARGRKLGLEGGTQTNGIYHSSINDCSTSIPVLHGR